MITFKDIAEKLNLNAGHITFVRGTYQKDSWTMDDMLKAVTVIGKTIDPRFVIDNDNRAVYENLVYWIMNDDRMTCTDPRTGKTVKGRLDRGIYIAGNTGSGKSVAMRIFMRMVGLNMPKDMQSGRSDPRFTSGNRIVLRSDEITDTFASGGNLERIKSAGMLTIQDLGSEPPETLYMGNRINVLKSVIEFRGDDEGLITNVTSNVPMNNQDLATRYGDRAVSRIYEMMNYLVLRGKDRRMNF